MESIRPDHDRLSFVEVLRSVKLKDSSKRLGLTRTKQFRRLSLWQKPQRFVKMLPKARHPYRGTTNIRVHAIPCKLPLPLQQSIVEYGFVEYKRDMSPGKLEQITQLRQDLDEKNPYVTPSGGDSSKFRVALRIIEKVYKKYEENLPLHLRPTSTFRYKSNVNKVLRKVLGPEESILPTRILVQEKQREKDELDATPQTKSVEHVQSWKEVEAINIVRRFKLNEIEIIDYEMLAEENALKERKQAMLDQATRLEELVLATEGDVTMATLQAHDGKLLLGRKVEKVKALNDEVGNLHRVITKTLDDLDQLQTYQRFFFQISPVPWRCVHDYLNPVRHGSEKQLVSLYSVQSVGDGLTGDLVTDMEYLEAMDKSERRRPKHLFFDHPQQVAAAFQDAEDTNLGMIQDWLDIQIRADELRIEFYKKLQEYDAEIDKVEHMMRTITEKADFEESQAAELKSVTRIYGMEMQNMEQPQVLEKIKALVKQTCVEICGRGTSNFSILIQLADIEREFGSLLDELDLMPAQYVRDLIAKVVSDEKKYLEQEADVARRVAEFQRLSQRVKRALAPPPSLEERRERLVQTRSAANSGTRRKRRAARPNNSAPPGGNRPGLEGQGAWPKLTRSRECKSGLA